ncbi:ABC transporter substrate-binding protein [Actinomadura sp. BRA 177]|uniref:ABC transporter substrate-binding protein n=1 Tax=Actinomadura sp. BRA 177 TaxID=2745202 RepID=UPI00159639E9|nr:ABC transporter substrate-binding protein [Actinomadura sp. BRA 177]NVI88344.1 ABC transporter substrate-binding protein [Actinomadura sp. BRA 177]
MLKKSLTALAVAPLLTLAACGGSGSGKAETGADGVTMGPGVTDDEISVTVISDFSGPIAQGGIAGSLGVEAKIDQVNREEGGVCGRKVVVDKRDTKYDPQITTQQYRAAAPDNLMVAQFVGTAGLNAVRTSIERDNMPTLSASINTQTLDLPNVYVAMPPFEVELINGLVWAAEEAGASATKTVKVGFVTSADETGKVYLDALNHAAKAIEGVEVVAEPTYTNADKDFTAQINSLKGAGAEIVMLGVTPAQTAGIIGQSAQFGYKPTFVSSSGAWSASLGKPLKGLLDNYYVSGGYGTLNDDNAGIRALTKAREAYAPDAKPDNFEVGGWINGTVVVAALRKACEAKALTREGVKKAMVDLEVPFDDILPPINLGDGNSIVSYQSRINKIGADGVQEPVAKFFESAAAKSWGETRGN